MEEEYRAFLLGPDGHVVSRVDLICEDEKAAREQAQLLAKDCVVELWKLATLISVFKPAD